MNIKDITPGRWKLAQDSEKEYWNEYTKETLFREEIETHRKKSQILFEEFSKFLKINNNTRILQIGCGPEDVINYFPKGKLYAIDPLADFYKKKFNLDYKDIVFLEARGEKIPFKNNFFDIVILANVLDHTERPDLVLKEIKRVLKDKGIFHFENTFYQKRFLSISKIWALFEGLLAGKIFNIHHPHMWNLKELCSIISVDFIISREYIGREIMAYENFEELRKKKFRTKKLKTKILASFGLYGDINYMGLLKKKD